LPAWTISTATSCAAHPAVVPNVEERGWRRIFRLNLGARHVQRDVDEEIAFHLEMRTRKLVANGLDAVAARAKALEQFGDLPGVRDECLAIDYDRDRTMRWTDRIEGFRQDCAYALRSLGKHPQFALAVIFVLALGIGGNTAIFALVDALLLRPLPVPHPERLVIVGDPAAVTSMWHGSPMTNYVSYPVYADLRERNHVLSGLYAEGSAGGDVIVRDGAGAEALVEHPRMHYVTANFFDVLQVPAFAGRTFTAEEDRTPGNAPVAVISYGYWRRRFAGDRSAIGTVLSVTNVPLTIVGVTPPGFTGDIVGSATDVWIPMMMQPALGMRENSLNSRSVSWLHMMGRLAPGATLERARVELATLETQSIRSQLSGVALSRFDSDLSLDPITVDGGARGFSSYRKTYAAALTVLMTAVLLVAVVICANVANLMLARSAARHRELTVRLALGAGRSRLVQLLVAECLVLAVAGGLLGLLVAVWGSRLLLSLASSSDAPITLDVSPDSRVLLFTGVITLLTAFLFGLVPAFRATRVDIATALRGQARSVAGSFGRVGHVSVGRLLVVGQVALSTLLLIGAGLLVRSMSRILSVDLGLDRDRLVSVTVSARRSGYDDPRAALLLRDLEQRLRGVPGVRGVGSSGHGVFTGGEGESSISVPGFVARADSERSVKASDIGPGFFGAVGARLVSGREFDPHDNEASNRVAVINETLAKHYFRSLAPIDRTILVEDSAYTIVGVVRDIEEQDVRAQAVPRLYTAIAQRREALRVFVLDVRVVGEPSQFVAPLRASLLAADRNLTFDIAPLEDLVRESVAQDLLVTRVTAFFGFLGLVLAAVGLYGVTAYATARRTGEFGLRAALGAEPNDIARMVLGEAIRLVLVGLIIGVPAGLVATRFVRAQIFGISPVDVPSLSAAIILLVVTALVASYLPARRAARVGPLTALRAE